MYRNFEARAPDCIVAYRRGRLIANLKSFERSERFYGRSSMKWRSGIKHDCSRVMELFPGEQGDFMNGLGKTVDLESTFLYPMIKSSELMKTPPVSSRFMLVTQKNIGEDTSRITHEAPRTWSYLEENASYLDKRASAIYRNRARFSIFGVGPYAFAPWKIAISGFYKGLQFQVVGPRNGKPVVFDDTCYFLPFRTRNEACSILRVLESEIAREFFISLIFRDSKRPITADLLGTLNLDVLSSDLGITLPVQSGETLQLPLG